MPSRVEYMASDPRPRPPLPGSWRAVPRPVPPSVVHRLSTFQPSLEEVSAGGIVLDGDARNPKVAVIARLNRVGRLEWCLPKGHQELGETLDEAAVREIREETGIEGEIVARLGRIDYWFTVNGRRIHKTVHHYLLRAVGGELSVEGDPDAEAVDAAWVPLRELDTRLSFGNERRIARAAEERLAETT